MTAVLTTYKGLAKLDWARKTSDLGEYGYAVLDRCSHQRDAN